MSDVLELLEYGLSFDEITSDYYPALSDEDIRACIRFAIEAVASQKLPSVVE